MTLTLNLPAELEEQLRHRAQRDGSDETSVALRVLQEKLAEEPPLSSLSEVEIMGHIHAQSFAPDFWQRYKELLAHVRNETMTEDLREEFIYYNDQVELANAERLRFLAELARRYNLTLPEVTARFGIGPLQVSEMYQGKRIVERGK